MTPTVGGVAIDGECRWALKQRAFLNIGVNLPHVAIDGECRWALKLRSRTRGASPGGVAIDGECRWALKPGHGRPRQRRAGAGRNRRRMPMGIETLSRGRTWSSG